MALSITLIHAASTGGGSYLKLFAWNVTGALVPAALAAAVYDANFNNSPTLTIDASWLEYNVTYQLSMTFNNLFHIFGDKKTLDLVRRQSQLPALHIQGPSPRSHVSSLGLTLSARIDVSPCLLDQTMELVLAWRQIGGGLSISCLRAWSVTHSLLTNSFQTTTSPPA